GRRLRRSPCLGRAWRSMPGTRSGFFLSYSWSRRLLRFESLPALPTLTRTADAALARMASTHGGFCYRRPEESRAGKAKVERVMRATHHRTCQPSSRSSSPPSRAVLRGDLHHARPRGPPARFRFAVEHALTF